MTTVERWEQTGPIPIVVAACPPPPGRDLIAVAPRPARMRGGFTNAQAAGIEARVRYAALPWWLRWREPRPPSWAQANRDRAGR